MTSKLKWIIGAVVLVVVAIPVGTFVYIHFIEGPAPAKLALSTDSSGDSSSTTSTGGTSAGSATTAASSATASSGDISGSWTPTDASQVGYRVKETLFGQSATAVGRTNQVTGTMTINGTTVSAVDLTVDMNSVSSDRSQRDGQFRGRIMDTSTYPTATFKLTQPIQLATVPTDDSIISAKATGDLTMHGTTKSVTFDLKAQRKDGNINVNGEIPIVFADYGIDNPSGGPASVGDSGILEFLVVFTKA
jgi:polyisoprenoid-binding protein YceI